MPDHPLAGDLDHILDHTRSLWEELRGQRVFITGGTGFFGCWLLESFVWANDRLGLNCRAVVLTRSPKSFLSKAPQLAGNQDIRIVEGDIRSFDFPAGTFSHIIHAATQTAEPAGPVEPRVLFRANVEGTGRSLELADQAHTAKFLFTSSGAVYGRQPPELTHISEDCHGAPETTDPATAYGQSKRGSEFLCASSSSSRMEVKIARCFAFVGPRLPLDANYAIGNFIRDGLQGRSIRIMGDGTPYRSYLYAADLAIWLWTILFKGKNGRPYNVGSDADLTIRELAQEVKETIAPQVQIEIAQTPIPQQQPQRYVPSIQRARTELGLDVQIPRSEAIRRTAEFYSR